MAVVSSSRNWVAAIKNERVLTGVRGLSDNHHSSSENLPQQVSQRDAAKLYRLQDERVNGAKSDIFHTGSLPRGHDVAPQAKNSCARCLSQLGKFIHKGSPCPSCGQRICSSCRIRVYLPKKSWLCTLCVQERQVCTTSGDWMLRNKEFLMRKPLPTVPIDTESRTLPRQVKDYSCLPYNPGQVIGSLPRNFTTFSDAPGGEFYTATRGRPVSTPGTPGIKKKAPAIPVFANAGSSTLGRPVKNHLLTPGAIRKSQQSEISTMQRPPVTTKEKYIHISTVSTSPVESRSTITFSPKFSRKEGVEVHPRLLNGVGGMSHVHVSENVKSATLDRFYLRRRVSFSEDSPSTGQHRRPEMQQQQQDLLQPSTTSATLPRAAKKVKRDESLISAYSLYGKSSGNQSLSLLNVINKPNAATLLTAPGPGLKKLAVRKNGIRHPSYAIDRTVFSRGDDRRRSFIGGRSSTRRSIRPDDPLSQFICNVITLDYDDFLSVVKKYLLTTAEFYLALSNEPYVIRKDPWAQLHISVIEIKPPVSLPSSDDELSSRRSSSPTNHFEVTESLQPLILPNVEFVIQGLPAEQLSESDDNSVFEIKAVSEVSDYSVFPLTSKLASPRFRSYNETNGRIMPDLCNGHDSASSDHVTGLRRSPNTVPDVLPEASLSQKFFPTNSEQQSGDESEPDNVPASVSETKTVVTTIFGDLPKLREVSKPTSHLLKHEVPVPEFQKVLGSLREAKKPISRDTSDTEEIAEEVDEVRKVSSAILYFKKINQESNELRQFLRSVRQSDSSVAETPVIPVARQREGVELTLTRQHNEVNHAEAQMSNGVTENGHTNKLSFAEGSDAEPKTPLSPSIEPIKPERIKYHSNRLTSTDSVVAEKPTEVFVEANLNEPLVPTEEIPVKKCVPSRPVLFTQGSEDEELFHDELEEESNSSAFSDDSLPAVKACRRAEPIEEVENHRQNVDLWELESQPLPYDYFERMQVPLFTIQEESEDEERESEFTRVINKRAMRPVSVDLSVDEDDYDSGKEDDVNGQGNDGQSNLEQYFITGLLQPATKNPYFRDDLDFDTLEDDVVITREEPSIFKSARLHFASSDYRLSSDNDMDDLSVSNPSDDESFY